MNDLTKLQMVLDGETDIVIRRDFSHPPRVSGGGGLNRRCSRNGCRPPIIR
jgi:hypothetical protein